MNSLAAEEVPEAIGPYRILREIGRGEEVHAIDHAQMERAMVWLRRREAQR